MTTYNCTTTVLANADVDTWLPGDGRTVPDIPTYLANNAIINVLDFGVDNTGMTDISSAITSVLTALGSAHSVIYFPAGRYLLVDFDFSSLSNVVFRGEPGVTTLTGGTHVVPNYSNPSLSGICSQRIGQFSGSTGVTFEDIIFDGAQDTGPTYYAANYTDQVALLEFRDCANLCLIQCTFINFTPAIPSAPSGGNPNPDVVEDQNQGPLFIKGCDQVQLLGLKLLTPCFGEGFTLLNCTRVSVEEMYSNAGIDSSPTYGTSTPLSVTGPLTQFVCVRNCQWDRALGSSLSVGGLGMIDVQGNTVNGGGGFNVALANLGYFQDWDQVGVGLRITGNCFNAMIDNTASVIPGIYIGSRVDGGFQYRDVAVHDNIFDSIYACISVRGCQDVSIARNIGSRLYVANSSISSEGIGILVQGCVGVSCVDNVMDMSVVPNGGGSSNRANYGFSIVNCDDVQCSGNQAIDGATNNFRLSVTDVYELPFSAGGTALRDALYQLDWFGTSFTVTGQTSGATLNFVGRVASGSWTANAATGFIYGTSKTGTFLPSESLSLNGTLNAAVATADASFASWMNRMGLSNNQSHTITSTVLPYYVQSSGTNVMAGERSRWHNLQDGVAIDPTAGASVGDADLVLSARDYSTQIFLSTLTADRTVTLPSSGIYPGMEFTFIRTGLGPFTLTIGSGVAILPPSVASMATVFYDSGWRLKNFSPLGIQAPSVSANQGDADRTFTTTQTTQTLVYSTTLTQNRTLTLSPTGAFNGALCHVVRNASTPGAFTLSVEDGGSHSTLYTFGANTTGNATFQFNGTSWILITPTGIRSGTATLDFPNIGAGAQQELTVTVTGATLGDSVLLGPSSGLEGGLCATGYVSASNTVTVRLCNFTSGAINPASATWRATVMKV